jgi:hypothetical protein
MALRASSLAPKIRAVSTCAEKTVSTANLTFAKLPCFCCSSKKYWMAFGVFFFIMNDQNTYFFYFKQF